MNKLYRAGIIGLGRIAIDFPDNHLSAYLNNPRVYLACICDTDERRINLALDKLGNYDCITSMDYLKMVKAHYLDIVSVCTPQETHHKIVCDIAPYVKAVYCEKPMAGSQYECYQMIDVCRKAGTILQINHQRRWVTPTFYYSRGVINTGSHLFDLLYRWFGEIRILDCKQVGDFNGDPMISGTVITGKGNEIRIEAVCQEEPLFTFNLAECPDLPIRLAIQDIVNTLDKRQKYTKSDGRAGQVALMYLQEFIRRATDDKG